MVELTCIMRPPGQAPTHGNAHSQATRARARFCVIVQVSISGERLHVHLQPTV